MTKLKPCPFCGNEAEIGKDGRIWCPSETDEVYCELNNENEWNHRPIEDKLQTELEQVKAKNERLKNVTIYDLECTAANLPIAIETIERQADEIERLKEAIQEIIEIGTENHWSVLSDSRGFVLTKLEQVLKESE